VTKPATIAILRHLAAKPGHDEVKADFHRLLVAEFGIEPSALDFERHVPEVRGRLDALIGRTIFEANTDLERDWPEVARRMPRYLADREREEGQKFVGIASDGRVWAAFELEGGQLVNIKEAILDPEKADLFLAWLDGIVVLKSSLAPDAATIRSELGPDSLAFRRSQAELSSLWDRVRNDRAVFFKRQLWAQLLKLVYGREIESDALWLQHTFLVIVAKCIALAVMPLREDDPKRLLSGEALQAAGILGAIESDVFDWVIDDPQGEALVRRIIAHVRRFRLAEVKTDVLKILYEALIDREERHGLGEYYTPDWLAAKIVKHVIDRPLVEHVLDPACGSGAFLFHAIRTFLREAEAADMKPELRAAEVCARVEGMDIHPVAVIIARVTYLLALAPALGQRRGSLSIPVYLGDAMQTSIGVAGNLSRPLAFSAGGGWASVLIGNPPWIAYRHMSPDLQKRFKELAKDENVHVGGRFATQSDFCALFTVRAAALYLRSAGRIAFVLPLAALTRGQFEKLRAGSFHSVRIAWDEAWTMDDSVEPLFPVPSCVVFGRRRATSRPLPDKVRAYSGALPLRDATEEIADTHLAVREGAPALEIANFEGGSPYRRMFRQGATLVPRMLCLVDRKAIGGLGADPSAPCVASRRTHQEKAPWKNLAGIENRVEVEFLRPVLLGESILPFRIFRPFEAVVPVTQNGDILDAEAAANRGFDALHGWMGKAEKIWRDNAESGDMTLIGRWNYHNELAAQFPLARLRVVYAKAGTLPAACIIRDARQTIDHKLYWAALRTEAEARFLLAILNSETARSRTQARQSRGQWGARDFDKVAFTLPIPRFVPENALHDEIAAAAKQAEAVAGRIPLPENIKFQRARGLVRAALASAGLAQRIDELVARLLDDPAKLSMLIAGRSGLE
jgi:N-6 DNA Methylase